MLLSVPISIEDNDDARSLGTHDFGQVLYDKINWSGEIVRAGIFLSPADVNR